MTTTAIEPGSRVAIWSLSPQMIGAYFTIFLLQYIPGLVFKGFTFFQQQVAGESVAQTAIKVIEASGPIGVGSAMNAIAIAISAEAVMVLARMLSKQQREEGRAEGIKEGIKQERKRSNAELRALGQEYGIPEEKLPLAPEVDE